MFCTIHTRWYLYLTRWQALTRPYWHGAKLGFEPQTYIFQSVIYNTYFGQLPTFFIKTIFLKEYIFDIFFHIFHIFSYVTIYFHIYCVLHHSPHICSRDRYGRSHLQCARLTNCLSQSSCSHIQAVAYLDTVETTKLT